MHYIALHCITLHYIHTTHGEYHLVYACRGHANARLQMTPSRMDAAGFDPGEGRGFTIRKENHAEQVEPKKNRHER